MNEKCLQLKILSFGSDEHIPNNWQLMIGLLANIPQKNNSLTDDTHKIPIQTLFILFFFCVHAPYVRERESTVPKFVCIPFSC